MLSNTTTKGKGLCSGCGACAQVCPKQCIGMAPDENGYIFPVVNKDMCIDCHQCENVCPFKNMPIINDRIAEDEIHAFSESDDDVLLSSASGGAFFAIIKALGGNEKWNIYGAVLDENLQVIHKCIGTNEDLTPFHKSKYVQSNLGDSFHNIKKQLLNGESVLFSGTPCQVAALRNYLLNVDTKKLVLVDLVCHGVPSQRMFSRYIKEEEKKYGKRIVNVIFRYKRKTLFGNNWDSRNIKIYFEDNTSVCMNRYKSRFLRAYYSFLFSRESCYKCPFAKEKRYGDLTIADFWGINKLRIDLKEGKGVSLIKTNTNKGGTIIKRMTDKSTVMYTIDYKKYMNLTNGAMKQHAPKNANREAFLKYEIDNSFFDAVDKYVPRRKEFLKVEIARRLNPKIRLKIKNMIAATRKAMSKKK